LRKERQRPARPTITETAGCMLGLGAINSALGDPQVLLIHNLNNHPRTLPILRPSTYPQPFSVANALNKCLHLDADPGHIQLKALDIAFDEVEGMMWNARSASLGNDTISTGIDASPLAFGDVLARHTS
jgi:hypothetical protein